MSAYASPGFLFPPLENSFKSTLAFRSSMVDDLEKEEKVDYEARESKSKVEIAIKDAKIDTATLIHALLATHGNNINTNNNSRRRPRISSRRTVAAASTCCSPHEEAMVFELVVSWAGQSSFTCRRNLPRFVQLYHDLQQERLANITSPEETAATTRGLPPIPRLQDENQGEMTDGIVGRGFSLLQELLRSYAPALEQWLQRVVHLVDPEKSPVWKQFLSEPDAASSSCSLEAPVANHGPLCPSQNSSCQRLGSIEESDTEQDDADD